MMYACKSVWGILREQVIIFIDNRSNVVIDNNKASPCEVLKADYRMMTKVLRGAYIGARSTVPMECN